MVHDVRKFRLVSAISCLCKTLIMKVCYIKENLKKLFKFCCHSNTSSDPSSLCGGGSLCMACSLAKSEPILMLMQSVGRYTCLVVVLCGYRSSSRFWENAVNWKIYSS